MLKLLEKFSQAVNNTISGRSIDHLTDTIDSSVLLGSAFIRNAQGLLRLRGRDRV